MQPGRNQVLRISDIRAHAALHLHESGRMLDSSSTRVRGPSFPAQNARGTLRFVPHADLRVLDVTRHAGYITNRTNASLAYDTFFSQDEKGQIRPRMVHTWTVRPDRRKWSFTPRDGL